MAAYYNEIDPYAAQWLRNLIAAGHIAPGDVDERSIVDVRGDDLRGYAQCHFFAGLGGWSGALRLAGWRDDDPVWTASCPCQPFSAAGKRGGVNDHRHLWPECRRLIIERRPVSVFGEQVASKDARAWLDVVCSEMETAHYVVGSVVTCAAGFGAPSGRARIYWVANAGGARVQRPCIRVNSGKAGPWGRFGEMDLRALLQDPFKPGPRSRWPKPLIRSLDDGDKSRVGRLRAYGNSIVVPQAAEFIRAYREVSEA